MRKLQRYCRLAQLFWNYFEAHRWYSQVGNKRLRELAKSRGMLELTEVKFKEMKLIRPSRIEKYVEVRNKLAAHYDDQIADMLQELWAIQHDAFFEDIEMMVRYSLEWVQTAQVYWETGSPNKC